MRVQFASDLHINSWEGQDFETLLEPKAKTLVLAGDIGHPDSLKLRIFLKWCSKRWDTVFWIPGHHEFTDVWHVQTRTFENCLDHMKLIASDYANIHVLHKDTFITDDGFLFLACPLWANLTTLSEEFSNNPLYKDITKQHKDNLQWLQTQIRKTQLPVVVATYYPPTYTLFQRSTVGNPLTVPYAFETETLLRPPVVAWICGYLHQAIENRVPYMDAVGGVGDVLVVINPRGYPDDPPTGYRKDAVLRLSRNLDAS
jgi:hypothetical protein